MDKASLPIEFKEKIEEYFMIYDLKSSYFY